MSLDAGKPLWDRLAASPGSPCEASPACETEADTRQARPGRGAHQATPFPNSYLRETVIQVFSDVYENQTQPGPCRPASFSLGTAAARHRGSPQPWAGPAVSAWFFLQNCHEAFEPPLCSETLFPFVLVDESISF